MSDKPQLEQVSNRPQVVIVMGVTGSGKTTVGLRLAETLNWEFRDGDDFHSPQARTKMARGIPLTDADRGPWLERLRALVERELKDGRRLVLACSALKQAYRDRLIVDPSKVAIVFLKGDLDLIRDRLRRRTGHFAGEALLASQFDTLQTPHDAVQVDISAPPEQIVVSIRSQLGL